MFARLFSVAVVFLLVASPVSANVFPKIVPQIVLPDSGLVAKDLAVIVNTEDPLSVQIAGYYQQQRQIPPENIITISFKVDKPVMRPGEFAVLKKIVEAKTPKHIQAYQL